jgi:hypothetical protein
VLAVEATFQALVTSLHVTSQYFLLCTFLISALEQVGPRSTSSCAG